MPNVVIWLNYESFKNLGKKFYRKMMVQVFQILPEVLGSWYLAQNKAYHLNFIFR